MSTVSPRDAITRWIRSNACWHAAGDQDVVVRSRRAALADFLQHPSPQRPITRRRPELQNVDRLRPVDHFTHRRPKFFQRKLILRRPRRRKTDPRLDRNFRRRPFHKRPASHITLDQPLRLQQFERGSNGLAIYAKQPSQFPIGWQPLPLRHPTRSNTSFNRFIQLSVKRGIGAGVELDRRKHTNLYEKHTILAWSLEAARPYAIHQPRR